MATIYRNYKDNVFCLLYRDRANLLELYNGLNGTDHKDPEELTVVTLPNTICIQYKNDAAFTFSKDLYLCEQQATENPNMPLRFLHYISEEYRHIVAERDLYRQNAVKIPAPHFVVFYNGTAPLPERQVYKLSDLYEGQKGKHTEQIAEELEESPETLQPIIDTAERFAPEYDIDSILRELGSSQIPRS